VPVTARASDRQLLDVLRTHGDGSDVVGLSRRPYRYATSAPLEELRVRMGGGQEMAVIFKDLSRDRLIGNARASKPAFLHEPLRELETYRRILAPAGIGPRWIAALAEQDPPRHWLLIEKVPGVELWQIGELSVWEEVAGWLGRFHARFAGRLEEVRAANSYLLEYSDEWFRFWAERARSALAGSTDRRASAVVRGLDRYDAVIRSLAALPPRFVHGELYPSNVLVVREESPVRVCPVDWEMAAIGPGPIDLAALVGGWGATERQRLATAYRRELARAGTTAPAPEALAADLSRSRLHLALQWLGWSSEWRPPSEHAHDWVGEALMLTEELGLH
jgi:aminoglycoside phosphotransferase (APT) family kinase protein